MQRWILQNKNKITIISGVFIALGLIARFALQNFRLYEITFLIASIVGVIPIAIQAYQSLRVKVIGIDVLVTIAAVGAIFIRNFEESAIVTFLFLFGDYLEKLTLNRTRSAIKELTELAPESALVLNDEGEFEEMDIDFVDEGDILLLRTGAKVGVDGTVISGEGSINEASITGESMPVSKEVGSEVFAGTILENGTIQIRADKVGEDTSFGKIIELVEEAQDSKSVAERFIDRFSQWYTPAVLVLGLVVGLITRDVELAITILVLGCPGALVIGVPVSNVAGIGNGAKNGVLIKGSEVTQSFAKIKTIVFDKTGTLTEGKPEINEQYYYEGRQALTEAESLEILASVEYESDHPLAKAVVDSIGLDEYKEVTNMDVVKGGGLKAQVDGRNVVVGNVALMDKENISLSPQQETDVAHLEKTGHSIVMQAVNGEINVLLGIKDRIRPGIKQTLGSLKKQGVDNLIVLSGDNQGTVDLVAAELGLTEAHGHMLPDEKAAFIRDLQASGEQVAFVGDGVNDSPSLALAEVGIAMGGGTDVAIETSDIVLMNSDFNKLPHAYGLAKTTASNMRQNIIIAVGVVLVLLASVFLSDWMNMAIGMLVHEGSILVVIFNAMRLMGYKVSRRHRVGAETLPEAKRLNV